MNALRRCGCLLFGHYWARTAILLNGRVIRGTCLRCGLRRHP